MSFEQALRGDYSIVNHPQLTLENYEEFGFHIEKNVFSADECKKFIKAAYDLNGARTGDFKPAMMPHRENNIFMPPIKKTKVVDIIETFVKGRPVGLQSTFFYCRPGTRGFSFHQDNFFLQANYGVFVSAWIALVDTDEANGGLIVYPESHKAGDLPVQKLNLNKDHNQDPNANNEETVVPSQYKPIHLAVPQGSIVFIHGHIVHGSNANQSKQCRYVLLNTYIKSGETFRSGNYAQREPIELRA